MPNVPYGSEKGDDSLNVDDVVRRLNLDDSDTLTMQAEVRPLRPDDFNEARQVVQRVIAESERILASLAGLSVGRPSNYIAIECTIGDMQRIDGLVRHGLSMHAMLQLDDLQHDLKYNADLEVAVKRLHLENTKLRTSNEKLRETNSKLRTAAADLIKQLNDRPTQVSLRISYYPCVCVKDFDISSAAGPLNSTMRGEDDDDDSVFEYHTPKSTLKRRKSVAQVLVS